MHLITNGKFKSVFQKVITKSVGPRISVASFLRHHSCEGFATTIYGSIKALLALLSEDHPPIYSEITIEEYSKHFFKIDEVGSSALSYLML